MSLKGVRQLKELVIRYSDYDGSSRGIREWMQTNLVKFAENNPNLVVKALKKRAKHPCLTGVYLNGNSKTIGIKNLSTEEIQSHVLHLRNQIGRKVKIWKISFAIDSHSIIYRWQMDIQNR
jgi:large subunit ribosomal protein L43